MPADIASINAVLELVASDTGRKRKAALMRHHTHLKDLLYCAGIDVRESESQIIALKAPLENKILYLKEMPEKEGVFNAPFCAPATPKKKPLLRLSLHSELNAGALEHISNSCLKAFAQIDM